MKIGIAQISPFLRNVEKNVKTHIHLLEKAKNQGTDLLVFPELSLTGYSLKDLVPEVALIPEKSPLFSEFKAISRDISFVIGFVEEGERGLFYNSAAYFSEGEILHIHRKIFLPTYGMFEEGKFFASGKSFQAFATPFGTTGMLICYDFQNYGSSYVLFSGGAEIIIVISAAPGRGISEEQGFTSSHMWKLMGQAVSRFSTSFLIYCNRVGIEEGKTFAGGSFVYGPSGKLLAEADCVEEELLYHKVDLNDIRAMRRKWPYFRDNKPEVILEGLRRIVSQDENQ